MVVNSREVWDALNTLLFQVQYLIDHQVVLRLWSLQLPHICISTSYWEEHNLAKELHLPYDESTMATASFMTLSPNSRA